MSNKKFNLKIAAIASWVLLFFAWIFFYAVTQRPTAVFWVVLAVTLLASLAVGLFAANTVVPIDNTSTAAVINEISFFFILRISPFVMFTYMWCILNQAHYLIKYQTYTDLIPISILRFTCKVNILWNIFENGFYSTGL